MHRMDSLLTTNYSLFSAPPHHYVVPSPYKQGESAIRFTFTVHPSPFTVKR